MAGANWGTAGAATYAETDDRYRANFGSRERRGRSRHIGGAGSAGSATAPSFESARRTQSHWPHRAALRGFSLPIQGIFHGKAAAERGQAARPRGSTRDGQPCPPGGMLTATPVFGKACQVTVDGVVSESALPGGRCSSWARPHCAARGSKGRAAFHTCISPPCNKILLGKWISSMRIEDGQKRLADQ